MEQLTDKQIKARAYYAANAEKIKAQKREIYNQALSRVVKPKVKPSLPIKVTEKRKTNPKPKYKTSQAFVISTEGNHKEHTPEYEHRNTSARQRIEDIKMKKELSVNYYD
jgi:hypothetical protein